MVDPEKQLQRQFDHAKTIFEQDCEEFRSLNGFLWQIPVIVSTLTGGLWFGVTKIGDDSIVKPAMFFLAGMVNLTFIVVLWRLRKGVMESLLDRIHEYQGRPRSGGRYTMIRMFTALLAVSSFISFIAFIRELPTFLKTIVGAFAWLSCHAS
jgi:hypothetical protein